MDVDGSLCSSAHLPRALWSKDECRQMCWQLDPTEGPGRVRRRMMRAPLTIPFKHILSDREDGVREGESEGGHESENVHVH